MVKREYKMTEVGVIPEDWGVKALGKAAKIQRGASPRPIDSPIWFNENSEIGWVRISDVTRSGVYLKETSQKLSEQGIKHSRPVARGNLIMSICATVGRPVITELDVCIHDGFVVFEGLTMDLKYTYHYLKWIEPNWAKQGQTGSQMNLNTALINGTPVPLPPTKAEQTAIATALSDVDTLLTSLDQLIAKKRDIKKAAMQQLLTGKTRLPGFDKKRGYKQTEVGEIPEDWEVEYIENIADVTTGNKNTQDRIPDGEYPFFVRSQTIERINTFTFDGEAVLTAGDGVGTGKVFHYINGKFAVHQRVYQIYNFTEKMFGFYFYLYFSQHFYNRIMQMTAKSSVDSVRRDMIIKMQIPLPPTKPEQTAIATILTDLDNEIAALEQRRTKTRAIKQAMMQELLTGRIRLVGGSGAGAGKTGRG